MISRADISAARASLASFVVVGIAWGGFAAQVPVIKTQIGATDGAFGTALFVAALGAIAAMWLAPRLDRRLGGRAMVVLSAALVLAYLLPGAAFDVVSFAMAMLAVSTCSGTLDVIMNARLAEVEARQARSLMNFGHATFSFAYAAAAFIAGVLRDLGWPPLAIFAVLGAISIALCSVIRQDQSGTSTDDPAVDPVYGGKLLWLAGVVLLIGFMAEQAAEGWSALHLERTLGADPIGGAIGPTLLGLTMGFGRLAGQGLAQKLAPMPVTAIAASIAALGAALAATAETLIVAYLGFTLLGLGVSVVVPMTFAHVAARVPPQARTTAIARVSVIGYTGFFIGPPLMGFLAQAFGLGASFSVIAALLLFVTLVFIPALIYQDRTSSHAR